MNVNAEIIAVGSELLLGQIANTNAQFISKKLAEIGVNVFYHTVVGDNAERLKHTIETAKNGRIASFLPAGSARQKMI